MTGFFLEVWLCTKYVGGASGEHLHLSSSNEICVWASETYYERGQAMGVFFFANGALYCIPLLLLLGIAIDTDTDTDRHPPTRPSMLFLTSFA
jgi:hypothetical protein